MSTQIDLGPVLSIPKGDWNASTTYERLNLVRHNSAAWICKVATSKGVEPTEASTDWFLQVKDTSAVTSINGQRGDVELYNINTPAETAHSTEIVNAEWVNNKVTKNLTATKEELEEVIIEQVSSAKADLRQYTTSTVSSAVSGISASLKDTQDELETVTATLTNKNNSQDTAIDDKVSKTKADNISGLKTFTTNPIIKNTAPNVHLNNTTFEQGKKPSSNTYWSVDFNDKNSTRNGRVQHYVNTDGQTGTMLETHSTDNTVSCGIGVVIKADGTPSGTAPTTPAGSNNTEIVTADYLASSNSNVVHRSGIETVAGMKTFTSNIVMSLGAPQLQIQQTDVDRNVKPSTDQYAQIRFLDKNNNIMGTLVNQQTSTGSGTTYMSAYGLSGKQTNIGVVVKEDGSVYAYAPSTPEGSTGNQIITADYLNVVDSGAVHKIGNETIVGAKTFTGNITRESSGSETKIVLKNTGIPESNVAPSANRFLVLRFCDAEESSLGVLAHQRKTNNEGVTYISATSRTGGETAKIEVIAPESGSPYATAPSTPANSMGMQIVTADFAAATYLPKVSTVNDSYLEICGGKTSVNGGTVAVYGVEHSSMPGAVVLTDNGNTPTQLLLVNAGITHGGKNLVKSVNGVDADTNGNVTLGKGVYIAETWVNNHNWYRKWSNGWIEQGGYFTCPSTLDTVTLNTPFAKSQYTVLAVDYQFNISSGGGREFNVLIGNRQPTGFVASNLTAGRSIMWYACGY